MLLFPGKCFDPEVASEQKRIQSLCGCKEGMMCCKHTRQWTYSNTNKTFLNRSNFVPTCNKIKHLF